MKKKRPPDENKLLIRVFARLTPIFSPEAGRRLSDWRRAHHRECPIHRHRLESFHRQWAIEDGKSCCCLTQASLGQLLGVSQRAISQIESGKSKISCISYLAFRSVLGDQAFFVLCGDENSTDFEENQHESAKKNTKPSKR